MSASRHSVTLRTSIFSAPTFAADEDPCSLPGTAASSGATVTLTRSRSKDEEFSRRPSLDGTLSFYNISTQGGSSTRQGAGSTTSLVSRNSFEKKSSTGRPTSAQGSYAPVSSSTAQGSSTSDLPPPVSQASNNFTTGILPNRAFFAPQRPKQAVASSAKKDVVGSGGEIEMSEPMGGTTMRRILSDGPPTNSTHSSPLLHGGSNTGFGVGGGHSARQRSLGGSAMITSSQEPLLSKAGPQRKKSVDLEPGVFGHHVHSQPGTDDLEINMPHQSNTYIPQKSVDAFSESAYLQNNTHELRDVTQEAVDSSLDFQHALKALPPQRSTKTQPTRGSGKKNYQLHPSSNTFFLSGRLTTGGDSPWPFITSMAIMFGMGGLWLGTTGQYLCKTGFGGSGHTGSGIAVTVIFVYLWGISISSMLATALRDPGILPRNLDLTPPLDATDGDFFPPPRDLRVRAGVVTVKYCETCKIYRPPRCSHCRVCGNCVEGIDHHCTYLHTCIGRRNYTSFIAFLTFSIISLIWVTVFSAIHIAMSGHLTHSNFNDTLRQNGGSVVAFFLSLGLVAPVGALAFYHLRLIFANSTTIEQIRRKASRSVLASNPTPNSNEQENPFAFPHWYTNFIRMACRPAHPGFMDFEKEYKADTRLENPGLLEDEERERKLHHV